MEINIQTAGFTLTDALKDHFHKRLAYSLAHGKEHITHIRAHLSDINGPRGGKDKRCLLQIHLKQQPTIVIEDIKYDMYLAINFASDRAGRNLARRISRSQRKTVDKTSLYQLAA